MICSVLSVRVLCTMLHMHMFGVAMLFYSLQCRLFFTNMQNKVGNREAMFGVVHINVYFYKHRLHMQMYVK